MGGDCFIGIAFLEGWWNCFGPREGCWLQKHWEVTKCHWIAHFQTSFWGLPWWLSGKESACQCRRHRFDPWSGKIPHATEQLSLWATTVEPARPSYWAHVLQLLKPSGPEACAPRQNKPLQWEALALQWRVVLAHCYQRKAHAAVKTHHSQK